MTIGELAAAADVPTATVRYYRATGAARAGPTHAGRLSLSGMPVFP